MNQFTCFDLSPILTSFIFLEKLVALVGMVRIVVFAALLDMFITTCTLTRILANLNLMLLDDALHLLSYYFLILHLFLVDPNMALEQVCILLKFFTLNQSNINA